MGVGWVSPEQEGGYVTWQDASQQQLLPLHKSHNITSQSEPAVRANLARNTARIRSVAFPQLSVWQKADVLIHRGRAQLPVVSAPIHLIEAILANRREQKFCLGQHQASQLASQLLPSPTLVGWLASCARLRHGRTSRGSERNEWSLFQGTPAPLEPRHLRVVVLHPSLARQRWAERCLLCCDQPGYLAVSRRASVLLFGLEMCKQNRRVANAQPPEPPTSCCRTH